MLLLLLEHFLCSGHIFQNRNRGISVRANSTGFGFGYTLLLCRISHARTGLYGYVTSSWYRRDRGIGIESRPRRSDIERGELVDIPVMHPGKKERKGILCQ